MASSVFFKFKSQKEPQRVPFDGTGISVFELKREIINISRLGDGTDFDLLIYNEHDNEEYNDDTTIIPRSTTVLARRLPASKPGQGRAARYISGKMPVNARNAYRTEQTSTPVAANSSTPVPSGATITNNMTEEEKIAAIHKMEGSQWEQQKQHMANATPVYRPGGPNRKPPPSDKPLPPHYFCYRCGEKGHHISNCPTNNDPNYDGKPKFKRTTGIPRSFLKEVEKPTMAAVNDGLTDDNNNQSHGVMRDADGKFVVAVPDEKSWKQYQSKAQASASNTNGDASVIKELEERGLACPIDQRLFADPVKTPCCGKTYCNECIENALINSDLVCPGCSTDNVLIDNLTPDEEMRSKIQEYEAEKKAEREKPKEKAESPKESTDAAKAKSESPAPEATEGDVSKDDKSTTPDVSSKKRPAEEELENDRKGDPPSPSKKPGSSTSTSAPPQTSTAGIDSNFIEQMNALAGQSGMNLNLNNPMGMPFPMSVPPMMSMPPQMMNPAMMGWGNGSMGMPNMHGMGGIPPTWNQQNGIFPGMNMNMNMNMNNMNGMNGMGYPQGNNSNQNNGWNPNMSAPNQPIPGTNRNINGIPTGPKSMANSFPNQQFGNQGGGGNDGDAYMRKPVNPHRHQGKQKKARPTDYREL